MKSEFCFIKFTLATSLKIKMRLEVRVRIETKRITGSFSTIQAMDHADLNKK